MSKKTKSASDKIELVKNQGSQSITSMFGKNADMGGMVLRSRAPLIKPSKWPAGQQLVGFITGVKAVERLDGKKVSSWGLIEISPDGKAVGVAIPATGTITQALEITCDDEKKGAEAVYSCPFIGHKVVIELLPDKIPSKKGNDAWNFVVAVSEKPAKLD